MANKIQDIHKWMEQVTRFGRKVFDVDIAYLQDDQEHYKFYLYTNNNKYAIYARCHYLGTSQEQPGYLGCVAQSRKYRPGENWFRGSDLADGPFSEKTWRKILADIVSYELQDVVQTDARKNHADTCIGPSIGD